MNQKELAWAAGFFDGEGYTACLFRQKGRGTAYIATTIGQVDRQVLDRFQAAVGVGKVRGPYQLKAKNQKIWMWSATANFEHAQAMIAKLWKFLSPVKRDQAAKALRLLSECRANNLRRPVAA